jgi:hypothetical protein
MSVIEQQRATVGDSPAPNVVRGFQDPGLTAGEAALLEAKEEAGVGDKILNELGYPYNTNYRLFRSGVNGGTNCFSYAIPSELLEEIKDMGERERKLVLRKWRLNEDLIKEVELSREMEGIRRGLFFQLEEILRQRIWQGTAVDLYTLIDVAREMMVDNPSFDFTGYWENLPEEKRMFRDRHDYPVSKLDASKHGNLIGGKPGWEITINGNSNLPIDLLWAKSPDRVQEVVYGERSEATPFDGFVFAHPGALLMPVLVVGGQAYIGGRRISHPNVGEPNFFSSTVFVETRLRGSYEDILLGEFSAQANVDPTEVFSGVKRSGGPIIPNSAHMTEAFNSHFANVRPETVEINGITGNYHFKGGDRDFVFVPIREVINNTPDGMAAAAASVVLGAARVSN